MPAAPDRLASSRAEDSFRRDQARIARAIEHLGRHWPERPTAEELAGQVGLSRYHFQRMFRRWAGISPGRFGQLFALREARALLERGASVLDTTLEIGLSGPGRLHDLFVHFEALSPGEYKSAGAGLDIEWAVIETPLGEALLATTPRGICHLEFLDEAGAPPVLARLRTAWPRAELRTGAQAEELGARLFSRDRGEIALHVGGTNFQVQVWSALLQLPPASAATYGDIARALGRPSAARAVGNAVGANPVAMLIPCHRVLRRSGVIGGYRWGETRKRALLAWEQAQQLDEPT